MTVTHSLLPDKQIAVLPSEGPDLKQSTFRQHLIYLTNIQNSQDEETSFLTDESHHPGDVQEVQRHWVSALQPNPSWIKNLKVSPGTLEDSFRKTPRALHGRQPSGGWPPPTSISLTCHQAPAPSMDTRLSKPKPHPPVDEKTMDQAKMILVIAFSSIHPTDKPSLQPKLGDKW